MRIVDYFEEAPVRQAHWREAISRGDWRAAAYLAARLEGNRLREEYGETSRLLLGLVGDDLAAFCTLSERDEIDAPELTPWIGFVYVFPRYRGQRRSGDMIERACALAARAGHERVYLSTTEVGLYEKYGFEFLRTDRDRWDGETRVYVRETPRANQKVHHET